MATTTVTGIGGIFWGGEGTITEDADDSSPDDGSGRHNLGLLPTARIITLADAIVLTLNGLGDALLGEATDLRFERQYSFGFATDEGMPVEPTSLKLLVRPIEFGRTRADRACEDRAYVLQLGAFKMVNKFAPFEIDMYVNLMASVANLFPENLEVTIAADGTLTLNDEDGEFDIVDGSFVVAENRFFPFILNDAQSMDAHNEIQVLFESRLQLTFLERGRAITEAT